MYRKTRGENLNIVARALDKAIDTLSPKAGLKRAEARHRKAILTNTGYSHYGASSTKKSLLGWDYFGGDSRSDIEDNLSVLRQRSRDLYMGVPIATGAVKTMRTNVVGRGLMLKPTIDAEALGLSIEQKQELEKKIAREWALWAESPDCDMARLNNFYELQQLAFLNWLSSGDCFALLPDKKRKNQPYDLRVRLIEADRVSSPDYFDTVDNKIVGGVEMDEDGEPLEGVNKIAKTIENKGFSRKGKADGKNFVRWKPLHILERCKEKRQGKTAVRHGLGIVFKL